MPRAPLFIGTKSEGERAMRAAAVRIGLGSVLVLAPGLGRRLFGVPATQDNTAVRLMARLFGVRQLALGAWALQVQARGPEERRLCYQVNMAVDSLDILALAVAGLAGKGMVQAAIMGSLLGADEALAWFDLLGDIDGEEPQGGSVALA
jgi:hypothetical protein